jgi:dGTPase
MTNQAEIMIEKLFERYMTDHKALPEDIQDFLQEETDNARARKISDYIAGMTDRFAIAEYERLI